MTELTRVVQRPDGTLASGRTLPGRGAWLCTGSAACLRRAARRRGFEHALRAPVPAAAVDDLADELDWPGFANSAGVEERGR